MYEVRLPMPGLPYRSMCASMQFSTAAMLYNYQLACSDLYTLVMYTHTKVYELVCVCMRMCILCNTLVRLRTCMLYVANNAIATNLCTLIE